MGWISRLYSHVPKTLHVHIPTYFCRLAGVDDHMLFVGIVVQDGRKGRQSDVNHMAFTDQGLLLLFLGTTRILEVGDAWVVIIIGVLVAHRQLS